MRRGIRSRSEILPIIGPMIDMVPFMAVAAVAGVAFGLLLVGIFLEARDSFRRTGRWRLTPDPTTCPPENLNYILWGDHKLDAGVESVVEQAWPAELDDPAMPDADRMKTPRHDIEQTGD